ncbi:MAG TPA: 4a-hydroxytetrahydrobiopterin dehydratase [Betaproteobacteria bacterium]|nr:4a-hydroxytetrahydrobiopterin dehydratase [Betaproteobacteria bacterium]
MNASASDPADKHCTPCQAGAPPLNEARIQALLGALAGWGRQNGGIGKTFRFRDYHETLAFVNATAWISHRENHHPELTVGYNQCAVHYVTHAVGGLSENDFICAAKIDRLFAP